ncbi:hypothetical protein ZHAS_00016950 [Anopheles sinensis]|uniref:Uncharacterized protein n=1 Tax=Anopheles sinensis TaxID=74873 RepID=A0A084WFF6_ANOSI|nr:hypothetical protein ZHAS_00016950 [Anopheles sinensis]
MACDAPGVPGGGHFRSGLSVPNPINIAVHRLQSGPASRKSRNERCDEAGEQLKGTRKSQTDVRQYPMPGNVESKYMKLHALLV